MFFFSTLPFPFSTSLSFSLSVCSCCMLMTKNMVFQCHPYWKALTCNRRHKSQPITHISKHTASLLGKMTGQAIRYWFILSDTVASNLNSLTVQVCRVEDLLKRCDLSPDLKGVRISSRYLREESFWQREMQRTKALRCLHIREITRRPVWSKMKQAGEFPSGTIFRTQHSHC